MISYSSSEARQLRRVALVGAITLVVSSSVFAVGIVAFRDDGPRYPARWDPRVAPIAIKVEALRGLTFKHPVKINYLTRSAFEKKLTATPQELKKQKKQIDQATALLRAAGLVGTGFDLAAATNTAQAADTIAFYSDRDEQIYMPRGPFTIETQVTLAHELTHVLQDQHFDLSELGKRADASESGSSDALTALIEGDADRIEHRYLARQTVGDRRAYRRLSSQRSAVSDRRTKAVPELVSLYFSAPYIFGPQLIRVLDTTGGNAAIDHALTAPALSTRIYFNPAAVHEPAPAEPPIPSLNTDEEKLKISGDDTGFDAFTFYLMLAAQLDRPDALRAADAFASGSEATYTRAGVVCFRAAILGVTPESTSFIASVLRQVDSCCRGRGARIERGSGDISCVRCRSTRGNARRCEIPRCSKPGRDPRRAGHDVHSRGHRGCHCGLHRPTARTGSERSRRAVRRRLARRRDGDHAAGKHL